MTNERTITLDHAKEGIFSDLEVASQSSNGQSVSETIDGNSYL
jgi:hypothetical protein